LPLVSSGDRALSLQVIPNQGLCIALHGFDSKGEPFIYPSDGGAHVKVQVRLVVFRPWVGEVICGKIVASDTNGMLGEDARVLLVCS
jgi:DNA-directed RNA polymerase III subunit RPC8